jgi:ribonuclease HII
MAKARRQGQMPELAAELALAASRPCYVGGLDEVGRGAWAGPVVVGVVAIGPDLPIAPVGVRDSKLIPEARRPAVAAAVRAWCATWAVGQATAREVDELGMTRALGLASWRALRALPLSLDVLIVDGGLDFVTAFGSERPQPGGPGASGGGPNVVTLVGADRTSSTVAAASVIAKVSRDAQMRALGTREPRFGFDRNKGYGTREHEIAIRTHGLTRYHRSSWSFAARLSESRNPPEQAGQTTTKG